MNTLKASGTDHTQDQVANVMSGGGAKALPRYPEMNPKEQKPTRGSGVDQAKHLADRCGSPPGSKP